MVSPNAKLWTKMILGGIAISIGGPALIVWVSPTEEELISRYNPDLKRRALENREQRQQDFDSFVTKLKEYSRSDKPIWEAAAEEETRLRSAAAQAQRAMLESQEKRKEEIRQQALGGR